jgi:ribosomal-protein-alanine N-acetyltransferase
VEHVEWLPAPLTAARVTVRRPRRGDETALVRLYTNAEVRQFIGGPLATEEAEQRAAQIVAEDAWGDFVIAAQPEDRAIGSGDIRRKRGPHELSFQLEATSWGQGLASEAVNALVTWFFTATRADILIAVTQDANQRSYRLLEQNGAQLAATFEQYGALQRRYEFRRPSWTARTIAAQDPA